MFYDTFYFRMGETLTELYESLEKKKYLKIDNYPFIHYLGAQELSRIPKELQMSHPLRTRDQVMSAQGFQEILSKYIEDSLFLNYQMDFALYRAIQESVLKEHGSGDIITQLMNRIVELVMENDIQTLTNDHLVYKFLLVILVSEFDEQT